MRAAIEDALRTFVGILNGPTTAGGLARAGVVATALAGTGLMSLGADPLLSAIDPGSAARTSARAAQSVTRGAQQATFGAVSGLVLECGLRGALVHEVPEAPRATLRPAPRIVAEPPIVQTPEATPLAQAEPAFIPPKAARSARRPWEYDDESAPAKPATAIAGVTAKDEPFVSAAAPGMPERIGAEARIRPPVESGDGE